MPLGQCPPTREGFFIRAAAIFMLWLFLANASWAQSAYTLQVVRTGSGVVYSSSSGGLMPGHYHINCGTNCSTSFKSGQDVYLTASPTNGYTFDGWKTSDCDSITHNGARCNITMNSSRSVTATFTSTAPSTHTLTVSKSGSGTVSSSPSGINCGSNCTASYNNNTSVTLTASPANGYSFSGWSGACSGSGSCTVNMNANKSVTATFTPTTAPPPSTYTLTVSKSGSGTISSSPSGINCGSSCTASYNNNTSVTLTASPANGYSFSGWSGACSGSGSCTVNMNANKSVTATFTQNTVVSDVFNLMVTYKGPGTIFFSPTDLDGYDKFSNSTDTTTIPIRFPYYKDTNVTLTAEPVSGYRFTGWSGACSGTGSCTVNMDSTKSVTAMFIQNTVVSDVFNLMVTYKGPGTIFFSPTDLDGYDKFSNSTDTTTNPIRFPYYKDTSVTLTAEPASGYRFTGWSGACSGTGSCTVNMDSTKSVTATFTTVTNNSSLLKIHKTGTGTGRITHANLFFQCSSQETSCDWPISSGPGTFIINAVADDDSVFAGWEGICSGTGACRIDLAPGMNIISISAKFNLKNESTGASACESRSFQPREKSVIDGYIAYYGRPPDAGGLNYWFNRGLHEGTVKSFGDSEEYRRNFGGMTTHELIDNLYLQIFGRHAEPSGLSWYARRHESGAESLAGIAFSILAGARESDSVVLDNRRAVSYHFVTLSERKWGLGRPMISDIYLAEWLATVNDSASSVDTVCRRITNYINLP